MLLISVSLAFGEAKISLDFWAQGEPGAVSIYNTLADQYMRLHPNVSISITYMGSELFPPGLIPALKAGKGPDIFGAGTGPGQPAAIIEAKLVADLTPYYFKYHWDKIIPPTIVNYTSSDGKLWAVGDSVEHTGMMYNKEIFAKLGLKIPNSYDEFIKVVDKVKTAGYKIPIGLGGMDKWPISHWQSMLFGYFAGPKGIDNVMFGEGRWDQPEFIEASRLFQKMANEGYFGPNPLSVGYTEVMDDFWAGKIPMTFTGTFVINDAFTKLGDEGLRKFGVFLFPPLKGQKIYPTEDIGAGWYISKSCKNPEVAADVINFFLFRHESRKQLLNSGLVPVGPIRDLLKEVKIPSLLAEFFEVVDRYRHNGTIHAYLDTVEPDNVTQVTYDGLQALIAGKMTPEQFVGEIQKEWEKAKAEGKILKPGGVIKPSGIK
jgi:raffinose/stachyose/melibiose transport system substrate-binding protein